MTSRAVPDLATTSRIPCAPRNPSAPAAMTSAPRASSARGAPVRGGRRPAPGAPGSEPGASDAPHAREVRLQRRRCARAVPVGAQVDAVARRRRLEQAAGIAAQQTERTRRRLAVIGGDDVVRERLQIRGRRTAATRARRTAGTGARPARAPRDRERLPSGHRLRRTRAFVDDLHGLAGRRVLLTGHTGFKGAWLVLWLARLRAEVSGIALDPPTRPSLFDLADVRRDLARHVVADIRDATARRRSSTRPTRGDPPPRRPVGGPRGVPQPARDVRRERDRDGGRARGRPPDGRTLPRGRGHERQVLRERRLGSPVRRGRPDGWRRPVQREQGRRRARRGVVPRVVLPARRARPPRRRYRDRPGRQRHRRRRLDAGRADRRRRARRAGGARRRAAPAATRSGRGSTSSSR